MAITIMKPGGISPERSLISSTAETEAPIVVLPVGQAARVPALALARELRALVPTAVDLSGRSIKALMRSAGRGGARVAVILGEEEVAQAAVTLRDLHAGEQESVPRTEMMARVEVLLQRQGGAP